MNVDFNNDYPTRQASSYQDRKLKGAGYIQCPISLDQLRLWHVSIFEHVSPYLQVQCTGRNPILETRNMMVAQCLLRSFGDNKDNLIAAMSCSLPQVTNVAATKVQSITHAVHWMYGLRRSQTKLHYGSRNQREFTNKTIDYSTPYLRTIF